jgi:hypothetical protein
MFGTNLLVNAYVVIHDGCPLAISVQSPEQVEITCGWGPNQSFDFTMDREVLRAFMELGNDALAMMDEALEADDPTTEPAVPSRKRAS